MRPNQVYAVVDIEATGGSIGADERIIQIACVLVKDYKIIHTFDTLVNPGKYIPEQISRLTGISNKDVKHAPFFEEIAPMILSLLENAIFVAHNVGFDYRFLNEQLKAHGFQQTEIPAIDTVELTQILYPHLDSFQLEDIATSLDYQLTDAHDALEDANATVHIFKILFRHAKQLPLVTLEKLSELARCTTHETYLFFRDALALAREELRSLDEDIVVVNQIAIRKPTHYETSGETYSLESIYPEKNNEKAKYFTGTHHFRKVQAKMMDLVFKYFKKEIGLEKLAIEAPPGIGKSLGYLFPSAFIASVEKPIVVSTYTTMLQTQLLEQTIPELEQILSKDIKSTLVKSRNHYISLSIFERWLNEIEPNDSEAYLCMRLLVWLTQTTTGDLSEMNAGSHLDMDFWQEIRVTNHHYIDSYWKEFDFFERIKASALHSEIIITNHHFLVHDWQNETPVIPNLEHLIIDEAHHFPSVANQSSTVTIHGIELITELEKMGSISDNVGISKLINYLETNGHIKAIELLKLDRNLKLCLDSWTSLFNRQLEYYENQDFSSRTDSNFVEHEFKLSYFTFKEKKVIKNIVRSLDEFIYTSFKIIKDSNKFFNQLNNELQLLLIEFGKLTTYLTKWRDQFKDVFTFDEESPEALRWVSYLPDHLENSIQFNILKWGEKNSFIDYMALHSKVIFTSSTLSFDNSEDYFSGQIKNLPLQYHQLESPFNYGEQVRVMVPEVQINPKQTQRKNYSSLLAEEIVNILKDTQVNTIILFRSLEVLKEVYEIINKEKQLAKHKILAQSITGTRKRILKSFKRNSPAVILGADSFFEGIDLPNEQLGSVILTRLPFPAPNTPIMRLKTDYLNRQGINPFMGEYLPQAILKFKQAFGRLIRNKTDKGVLVILDERFMTASYSNIFKEAIPRGVPIEIYKNDVLGKEIDQFIQKK